MQSITRRTVKMECKSVWGSPNLIYLEDYRGLTVQNSFAYYYYPFYFTSIFSSEIAQPVSFTQNNPCPSSHSNSGLEILFHSLYLGNSCPCFKFWITQGFIWEKVISVIFPPASKNLLFTPLFLYLALCMGIKGLCVSLPYFSGAPQGQGPCLIHLCNPSTDHSGWHKEGTQLFTWNKILL